MIRSLFTLSLVLIVISTTFSQKISKGKKMEIKVTSSAFKDGEMIPSKYTCDGINISPPIHWQTEVKGIKSFALIADDPDAPSGDWEQPGALQRVAPGRARPVPETTGRSPA